MQKAIPYSRNGKPYWHWRCSCGFDDNRNTDRICQKCGEKITCATAGGHNFPMGQEYCKYNCGTHV